MKTRTVAMLKGNRKLLLLIVLLTLLAFSLFFQFTARTPSPSSGPVGPLSKSGSNTKGAQDPLLMMDALQATKPEYPNEKRNIFAFPAPPPPPVTQMAQQEPPPPV
ncbi:MAG TPA: hypothetical protein VI958_06715, partial [Acidobacteriota bacterium]